MAYHKKRNTRIRFNCVFAKKSIYIVTKQLICTVKSIKMCPKKLLACQLGEGGGVALGPTSWTQRYPHQCSFSQQENDFHLKSWKQNM